MGNNVRVFGICPVIIGLAIGWAGLVPAQESDSNAVALTMKSDRVDVNVDGQPFTSLHFKRPQKPILYPVYGPGQVAMTRNWPIRRDGSGEATDHPHHQSIWFGHEVNGVDFWAHRSGVIKVREVELQGQEKNRIQTESDWIRADGEEVILTDRSVYQFGGNDNSRWIDFGITLIASEGEIELEDTKEGCFAIRTHPDLRLTADPKRGVEEVFGTAINSNGDAGKEVWGKAAAWVLYSGPVDGTPMAVAMYDHPGNLRHPTTWHARDYGLIAANPFGLHYFSGQEPGAGAVTLAAGESLTLNYRVEFFAGNPSAATVAQRFEDFAGSVRATPTRSP